MGPQLFEKFYMNLNYIDDGPEFGFIRRILGRKPRIYEIAQVFEIHPFGILIKIEISKIKREN